MFTIRSFITSLAGAAFCWQSCLAHSVKRGPVTYVSIIDDVDIRTPLHKVHAFSKFDITFTLHDGRQHVRLALEPNHDILHDELTVSYLDDDGKLSETRTIDRTSHRVFKGSSFIRREDGDDWSGAGIARLSIHQDGSRPVLDGHFRIDGNSHHIQTVGRYMRLKHPEDPTVSVERDEGETTMLVWRDSDLRSYAEEHFELKRGLDSYDNSSICDVGSLGFNSRLDEQLRVVKADSTWASTARPFWRRQSIDGGSSNGGTAPGRDLTASIGSTEGCPTANKVALVGLATDCTYWDGFSSEDDIRKSIVSMVNQASEVYEKTFKITIRIKNLVISKKECPSTAADSAKWNVACGNGVDISDRLSLFSEWRGQQNDSNAYWTLLTTCNTESAVGLAWPGQLCQTGSFDDRDSSGQSESVTGANVVVRTDTEWQIFAHETGHTFGAVHDCSSATCPETGSSEVCCPLSGNTCNANAKYIMNPSTGEGITEFSPCTIGNICSGLKGLVNSTCLSDNKNIKTYEGSQCGNGIVEEGEDCDCGSGADCQQSKCCDYKTCKFKSGSVCDPSNEDCCTDSCRFMSNSTVCRASTGQCDVEEKCSGNGGICPQDKFQANGMSCGKSGDGLSCASGQCTSRDQQCKNRVSSLGSSDNTSACDNDSGCSLTCQSDDNGQNQCVSYSADFIDGTSCGAGGRCSNGSCKGSSTSKEARLWIMNHKAIVIPVASVIGILLLLAIGSCLLSCIRRRRSVKRRPTPPPQMNSWPGQNYAGGPTWGPHHGQEPTGDFRPPPPPPPSYYQHPNDQQWQRGGSARWG